MVYYGIIRRYAKNTKPVMDDLPLNNLFDGW